MTTRLNKTMKINLVHSLMNLSFNYVKAEFQTQADEAISKAALLHYKNHSDEFEEFVKNAKHFDPSIMSRRFDKQEQVSIGFRSRPYTKNNKDFIEAYTIHFDFIRVPCVNELGRHRDHHLFDSITNFTLSEPVYMLSANNGFQIGFWEEPKKSDDEALEVEKRKLLKPLNAKWRAITKEMVKALSTFQSIVASCSNAKQLVSLLPEAEQFLPRTVESGMAVMVSNESIDEVKVLLNKAAKAKVAV
jgi:hypothetical protein